MVVLARAEVDVEATVVVVEVGAEVVVVSDVSDGGSESSLHPLRAITTRTSATPTIFFMAASYGPPRGGVGTLTA